MGRSVYSIASHLQLPCTTGVCMVLSVLPGVSSSDEAITAIVSVATATARFYKPGSL